MTETNWMIRAKGADLRVRNFINGKYIDSPKARRSDNTLIRKYSPRDGSLLYHVDAGNIKEVNQAVIHACESFNDERWHGLPMEQRQAVLKKLADLIEANQEELALYDCLDVGKPITQVLTQDIPIAVYLLRGYADKADKLFSLSQANGGNMAYQLRKPVGVVGSIIGWNYPLSVAITKAAPALVMGNSVVLKPSEFSSLSASHLAALAVEAGVPPGVFNVVHGGAPVGAALAGHSNIDLLSFTGSSATGKQIMTAAGQSNMKRLMLECGGKSPYIIFDDCPDDVDLIAADVVDKAFRNQGEWCSAGSRLLIQEGIKDKLLPKIVEQAAQIKPQDPLNPTSRFGALINETHMNKVLGYIDSGKKEGAKLILGGKRVFVDTENVNGEGYYVEPTIFDHVDPQQKIAQEEIFGPVLSVLTFQAEEEAIRLANNTCYGLAAYAATENLGRAQRLGRHLNSGYLSIFGASPLSAGGGVDIGSEAHRQSGFGYETGLAGLASYTVSTAVHIST